MLLEVVLAVTIAVGAMGILAAQLINGLNFTGYSDEQTRAGRLVDRILTLIELDLATQTQFFADRVSEGDFGEQHRGWFWRARVDETPVDGLGQLTIEILRQTNRERLDSIADAAVVRRVHMLKADPGRIDLEKDFGVSPDQLEALSAVLPIAGIDPTALNPQEIVSMPPEMLLEMLPMILPLIQQFGGGAALQGLGGGQLPPEVLQQIMEAIGGAGGLSGISPGGAAGQDGSGADQGLRDMIRAQLGDQITDEQLDQLMNQVGNGQPQGGGPPTGGARTGIRGGQRGPLSGGGDRAAGATDINELNNIRNQRNGGRRTSGGRGSDGGGRGGRG